jgi:exodeoxyribonuclease V alpha subunit
VASDRPSGSGDQTRLFAGPEPPTASLAGELGRIVYRNPETLWTVARLIQADGTEATIVGELPELPPGMPLTVRGQWVDDKKFGRQLKLAGYTTRTPETLAGIERFLGSGIIPGIGGELARRMVAHFKMDTLSVIEGAPERLTEVDGIGRARADKIAAAFAEHRYVQDVMVFLLGHGVSIAFAARIVKRYGKDAIRIVSDNPYRLALEVWGIGFRTSRRDRRAPGPGQGRAGPPRGRPGPRPRRARRGRPRPRPRGRAGRARRASCSRCRAPRCPTASRIC